jgi:hypothetical protein
MILQTWSGSVIHHEIDAPIYRASGSRTYIAIYRSHYVRLQRDYQTAEWCKIERFAFDPAEPLPFEHPVHQSYTDRYHPITATQFNFYLDEAVKFTMSNYEKTPVL